MGFKPRKDISFAAADGWVLAAAAHAGARGLASWRAIVGSGDYMNRAILTYDELAGAAARLHAGGLARFERGGMRVSPAVLALVDDRARDLRTRFARVWALPAPGDRAPTVLALRLSRDAYDEAVRIHTAWG